MKVYHSEALTLRTYPYSETHRIAVFLTRLYGKVRGVVYGAARPRTRFSGSLEPLTLLRLTFTRKEQQELAVVKNCEVVAPPPRLKSWEGSLYLGYFTELLHEFSHDQDESERLFRLALAVLEASREGSMELVARYFELWVLRLEGVLPDLVSRLPPRSAARALDAMKKHPARLSSRDFKKEDLKRLETLCAELIEYHLEKQLKARKLLKQFT